VQAEQQQQQQQQQQRHGDLIHQPPRRRRPIPHQTLQPPRESTNGTSSRSRSSQKSRAGPLRDGRFLSSPPCPPPPPPPSSSHSRVSLDPAPTNGSQHAAAPPQQPTSLAVRLASGYEECSGTAALQSLAAVALQAAALSPRSAAQRRAALPALPATATATAAHTYITAPPPPPPAAAPAWPCCWPRGSLPGHGSPGGSVQPSRIYTSSAIFQYRLHQSCMRIQCSRGRLKSQAPSAVHPGESECIRIPQPFDRWWVREKIDPFPRIASVPFESLAYL
jgi:hypothetical protein